LRKSKGADLIEKKVKRRWSPTEPITQGKEKGSNLRASEEGKKMQGKLQQPIKIELLNVRLITTEKERTSYDNDGGGSEYL